MYPFDAFGDLEFHDHEIGDHQIGEENAYLPAAKMHRNRLLPFSSKLCHLHGFLVNRFQKTVTQLVVHIGEDSDDLLGNSFMPLNPFDP